MSMPARKSRGRPFKPGNAGRPPGSRNKTTQLVEQLAEDQAEQLINKALELAQGGDVSCLRMMIDRLWPLRKGQPVSFEVQPIKTSQDVFAVMASVWTAIGDGRLTPDEASALSLVVERSMQALQIQDIVTRIDDLEERLGKCE